MIPARRGGPWGCWGPGRRADLGPGGRHSHQAGTAQRGPLQGGSRGRFVGDDSVSTGIQHLMEKELICTDSPRGLRARVPGEGWNPDELAAELAVLAALHSLSSSQVPESTCGGSHFTSEAAEAQSGQAAFLLSLCCSPPARNPPSAVQTPEPAAP